MGPLCFATDATVEFYNTHLHSEGGDAVRLPQAQKTDGGSRTKTSATRSAGPAT